MKTPRLEFIEDGHLYLWDGILIPSVSDVLSFIFPDRYKGIPESILEKKAKFGVKVHKAIELYESTNVPPDSSSLNYIEIASVNQYLKLAGRHNIRVVNQERMVCFEGRYAGRYDMEATIEGQSCLVDIKTTAALDREYLSWQLSYYELARKVEFDKLYAIWLPKKGIGKLMEIERKPKKELLDKLEEYEAYLLLTKED